MKTEVILLAMISVTESNQYVKLSIENSDAPSQLRGPVTLCSCWDVLNILMQQIS
jgi:hypothetical protein